MVTPVMAEEAIDIVFPKDSGIVDVTKPPYNAKGDGVTDDTAAINAALRDHNYGTVPVALMAVTFPPKPDPADES
ncbi:MAG: hypothetical protein HC898_08610 [Phycisphaerales bacterium]|nr:hypothetical protein [Phycisphaerales bacterium]